MYLKMKTSYSPLHALLGCLIAGIDLKKVSTMDASDCLVATYARKLQGLRAPEKASLQVNESCCQTNTESIV